MNAAAVRQALADVLEPLSGNASPYVLAQPTPPGFQILPPGLVSRMAMGVPGLCEWEFVVQGFVSLTTDVGAQKLMDEWIATEGVRSVAEAVETDPTLDGTVQKLAVTSSSPARQVEQPPGNPMLLVEWRLTVYA